MQTIFKVGDLPDIYKYDEIFVCDDGEWMKAYFLVIIVGFHAYISASFEKDGEPHLFNGFALENPLINPDTPIYKAEDYI